MNARATTVSCFFLISFLLWGAPGCGHYRAGKSSDTAFRTIYIEPVANRSFAPQAQALVSTQVREHIARDGRLRIVGRDEADAILRITLEDYSREAGAARGDDTALATKFTMGLSARCTLLDARTGDIFFEDRRASTEADGFFDDPGEDLAFQGLLNEYQTMPVLTARLSRDIGNMVLHTW